MQFSLSVFRLLTVRAVLCVCLCGCVCAHVPVCLATVCMGVFSKQSLYRCVCVYWLYMRAFIPKNGMRLTDNNINIYQIVILYY